MIVRRHWEAPAEYRQSLRRAVRLEWWTIFFLATIGVVMYLTMGSSQAMKTAWIEDLLSLIPPILFLVSVRIHDQPASPGYPYGKRRIFLIAFLGSSLALLGLGGYMLLDAVMKLVNQEHPTVGIEEIFGRQVWLGWLMIAALVYSIVPPVILGRLKIRPSKELHDKTLHADADMNKADWMTAVAAIVGVLGIGAGFWWADASAAALISADIVWDGVKNLRRAVQDLLDGRPTTVEKAKPDPIGDRLRHVLLDLPWVKSAGLRLREEGHIVAGEAYVVPDREEGLLERLSEAESVLARTHWRVRDVVVVPLSEEELSARVGAASESEED